MRPRVAHISTVHRWNDARIFRREIATLANAGYEVDWVVPVQEADEPSPMEGVKLHPLKRWRRMGRVGALFRVLSKAAALRADLYHVHDPELLTIVAALRRRTGAPVIYDKHEYYRGRAGIKSAFIRLVERLLVPTADAVVVVDFESDGVTPDVDDLILSPDRVVVVPNYPLIGVARGAPRLGLSHGGSPRLALPMIGAAGGSPRLALPVGGAAGGSPRLGLSHGGSPRLGHPVGGAAGGSPRLALPEGRLPGGGRALLRLVYTGVLAWDRGLWKMLDVVEALQEAGRSVELTLAGVSYRPAELREFESAILTRGLAGSIRRIGWDHYVPWDTLFEATCAADVGLMLLDPQARSWANIPTKFYEYLAAGIPFVCTDYPSWRTFVERVGSGVPVDVGSADGVSRAIVDLVDTPSRYAAMSDAGLRAAERFIWSEAGNALTQLYERLIGATTRDPDP